MTPSPTSSPPFVLNFKPLLAKSGLRNRTPETLPTYWAPNSTGLFDFSPASDQPPITLSQTEAKTPKLILPDSPSLPLVDFVREAWPILEPATQYRHNWHIDVIADHLEAISRGELQDLLVNVPPGFMKSLLVSVLWPAWEWTWLPWTRWLFTSYDAQLSIRDALKTRRLIESEWYQERWGQIFQLTTDQNQKTRYENDRTGWRIATSMNGLATGEHANRRVADDPHKVKEAESELDRASVVTTWKETMTSRGIATSPLNARVMVMQRVHHQDVAADWLEREPHVHQVLLPNEYEQPAPACDIAEHDPRQTDGELLWPAMVDQVETLKLKTTKLGAYGYAGQYQQRPTPRAGLILDPAWFVERPTYSQVDRWHKVLYFDTAESEKQTADYTAGVLLYVQPSTDEPRMHIGGLFHERVTDARLDESLAATINAWRPHSVGIEERAFKQQAIRLLVARVRRILRDQYGLTDVHIESVPVDTDKVLRARVVEPIARAGFLSTDPRAPWWPTMSTEMTTFPLGAHDDTIDALSGAVQLGYKLRGLLAMREATRKPSDMHVRTGAQPTHKPSELETMVRALR
jgi:predicted phage terminase large subunit-like protein